MNSFAPNQAGSIHFHRSLDSLTLGEIKRCPVNSRSRNVYGWLTHAAMLKTQQAGQDPEYHPSTPQSMRGLINIVIIVVVVIIIVHDKYNDSVRGRGEGATRPSPRINPLQRVGFYLSRA